MIFKNLFGRPSYNLVKMIDLYYEFNKKTVPMFEYLKKNKDGNNEEKKGTNFPWRRKQDILTQSYCNYQAKSGKFQAFAMILEKDDLIVDVDPRNFNKSDSLENLETDIGFKFTKSVKTCNGGYHIYLKLQNQESYKNISKNLNKYPGIDFLKYGNIAIIPYSIMHGKKYELLDESFLQKPSQCPEKLLTLLQVQQNIGRPSINISREYVRRTLFSLDPDTDYDQWYKIGMALHSHPTDDFLDLFIEWSSQSPNKFNEEECIKKWDSFKKERVNGITIKSLFYFKNKQKKGSKINPEEISSNQAKIEEFFNLASKYYYIINKKILMHKETKEKIYALDFNIKYGKMLPSTNNKYGIKRKLILQEPFKYASDFGAFDVLHGDVFLPSAKTLFIDENGNRYLNIFNHKHFEDIEKNQTYKNEDCVKRFEKYMKQLAGDENYEFMLDWFSTLIQHPGRLFGWAPIIQCSSNHFEKNYIVELLKVLLTEQYVTNITPLMVHAQFNDWAENTLVNVFEEFQYNSSIKQNIENIEAIKSYIVDSKIVINRKNIIPNSIQNITNYILFVKNKNISTFNNQVETKLDDIYFYIQSGIKQDSISSSFYKDLWNDLDVNKEKLQSFFHNRKISEEFLNMKKAPKTRYLEEIDVRKRLNIPGLYAIQEMIKNASGLQNLFYNENYIISLVLFFDYERLYCQDNGNDEDLKLSTQNKNQIISMCLEYTLFKNRWTFHHVSGKSKRGLTQIWVSSDFLRIIDLDEEQNKKFQEKLKKIRANISSYIYNRHPDDNLLEKMDSQDEIMMDNIVALDEKQYVLEKKKEVKKHALEKKKEVKKHALEKKKEVKKPIKKKEINVDKKKAYNALENKKNKSDTIQKCTIKPFIKEFTQKAQKVKKDIEYLGNQWE